MSDYGWAFAALAKGRHQHTLTVITTADGEPSGVVCETCGHAWPIDEDRYLAPRRPSESVAATDNESVRASDETTSAP